MASVAVVLAAGLLLSGPVFGGDGVQRLTGVWSFVATAGTRLEQATGQR
jgi:hypothetical protein